MSDTDLFPVVCTVELPTRILETFLKEAYSGSAQVVPGTPPSLVILTSTDTCNINIATQSSIASQPPLQSFVSPFLLQSVEDVSKHPILRNFSYFAVLDERSARDHTAILVAREVDDSVSTVRVAFSEVQKTLISLGVGSIGFEEIKSIAHSDGGVLGLPVSHSALQGGLPAPRMKLGG